MIYYGSIDGTEFGFYLEMDKEKLQIIGAELSDEEHIELVERANSEGKLIVQDSDNKPTLANPPDPTEEELADSEINEYKAYLASTDYCVLEIAEGEKTKNDYKEILQQRKEARKKINELEEKVKKNNKKSDK